MIKDIRSRGNNTFGLQIPSKIDDLPLTTTSTEVLLPQKLIYNPSNAKQLSRIILYNQYYLLTNFQSIHTRLSLKT